MTFGLVACGGARADDDLAGIEKELMAAWAKVKSLSARMTMSSDTSTEGGSTKVDGNGTIEIVHQESGNRSRVEMKTKMVANYGGNEMNMESSMLTINDGTFSYTLMDQNGQKMAMKSKADESKEMDVKRTFEHMRKNGTAKRHPDETIDGHAVFVVEFIPKDATGGTANTTYYFDKSTGFSLKMLVKDEAGKPMVTTTFSDVKVNSDIPADRFVFQAPEGVTVTDMTKH